MSTVWDYLQRFWDYLQRMWEIWPFLLWLVGSASILAFMAWRFDR